MNLKISEMPELSALGDDDYLVLQRKEDNSNQSYKIQFSDFKRQFLQEFDDSTRLGSAASCDGSLFAEFAHGHDYTDLYYFPSYGPKSYNSQTSARSTLCCMCDGTFNIVKYLPGVDQKELHVISAWQPKVTNKIVNEISDYQHYRVGDLQLLAVRNFHDYLTAYRNYQIDSTGNININHSSFDGFVIPNGKTFNCSANSFQSACRLYGGGNPYATSFTVPKFSYTFFKCDPGLPTATMNPMSTVPVNTVLVGHDHSGTATLDTQSISVTFSNASFSVTAGLIGTGYINSGDGVLVVDGGERAADDNNPWLSYSDFPDNYKPGIDKISLTCTSEGSMTCGYAGNEYPTYPKHVYVQALLYIGKSWE